MIEKVKLISTIAKSEVIAFQAAQEISALSNDILPQVDEICQTTDTSQSISDRGLFMICLLTRLQSPGRTATCREIMKILLVRAANYLILRAD